MTISRKVLVSVCDHSIPSVTSLSFDAGLNLVLHRIDQIREEVMIEAFPFLDQFLHLFLGSRPREGSHSSLENCPQILNGIKVWTVAGPVHDLNSSGRLRGVTRSIVLLKDKASLFLGVKHFHRREEEAIENLLIFKRTDGSLYDGQRCCPRREIPPQTMTAGANFCRGSTGGGPAILQMTRLQSRPWFWRHQANLFSMWPSFMKGTGLGLFLVMLSDRRPLPTVLPTVLSTVLSTVQRESRGTPLPCNSAAKRLLEWRGFLLASLLRTSNRAGERTGGGPGFLFLGLSILFFLLESSR